jgi:hypothetical protein
MIISMRVWDRSSSAPKAGSEHDDLVTLLFQGAPDKVSDHRLVIEDQNSDGRKSPRPVIGARSIGLHVEGLKPDKPPGEARGRNYSLNITRWPAS